MRTDPPPRRRPVLPPLLFLLVAALVGVGELFLAARVHELHGLPAAPGPLAGAAAPGRRPPPGSPRPSSAGGGGAAKGDESFASRRGPSRSVGAARKEERFAESLLVLMNVRIQDEATIAGEVRWIGEDARAVCRFHAVCRWEVNVVATSGALMQKFERSASSFPPDVHWIGRVFALPFNKFAYIRDLVDAMGNYDLVLLKDNDQRIAGFPWKTFVEKRSNAIISGPLRDSPRSDKKRLQFQIHEACHYRGPQSPGWSRELYDGAMPVEVPLLEMYLVLFDAAFARYFFGLVLKDAFVDQASAWGPDFLWCHAARSWDRARPGCYLVPGAASTHEDSRQIVKDNLFRARGREILKYWERDPLFKQWMGASWEWQGIIGGKTLREIEQRCRGLLGLGAADPFDFRACARKPLLPRQPARS